MKSLSTMLIALFALCSCGKKVQMQTENIYKDSLVEKHVVVKKDTTIYIAGDSVTIHDTVPCPEVNYERTDSSKDGKVKLKVSLKNGKLTADCKTDSLQKLVEWWESEYYKEKYSIKSISQTKTIEVPVDVIVYRTAKWHWYLHGLLLLLLLWLFRHPIISFTKHLIAKWN